MPRRDCLLDFSPGQPDMLRKLAALRPIQWPAVPRAVQQHLSRDESRRRQAMPPTYLQRLLGLMHDSALPFAADDAVMAYGALLDCVLEDRRVDDAEADALLELATKWGLNSCYDYRWVDGLASGFSKVLPPVQPQSAGSLTTHSPPATILPLTPVPNYPPALMS